MSLVAGVVAITGTVGFADAAEAGAILAGEATVAGVIGFAGATGRTRGAGLAEAIFAA